MTVDELRTIVTAHADPLMRSSLNTQESPETTDPAAVVRIPSCVVGVIFGDTIYAGGFGMVSETFREPPREDTRYEIASLTKLLTGVLLAEMVGRGEVTLDEPLISLPLFDSWRAENANTMSDGLASVTLEQIATHRSGLPRLTPHFWDEADRANPYAHIDMAGLVAALSDLPREIKPGVQYEYSNFGFALLGHALASRAGTSYAELLRERLLAPLGMNDTLFVGGNSPEDERGGRWGTTHTADGTPCPAWDLAAFIPGGGIRTSISEMNRFAAAALGRFDLISTTPEPNPEQIARLRAAFTLAQTPRADKDKGQRIGLAWFFDPKRECLLHDGLTGGSNTILLIDRPRGIAVTVLSNSNAKTSHTIANAILQSLRQRISE